MENELIIPGMVLAVVAVFLLSLLLLPKMRDFIPYLYLNARIAVKEGRLIKPNLYQEMVSAHSVSEVVTLLQGTSYSVALQGVVVEKKGSVESVILDEMALLYGELRNIMPERLKNSFAFLNRLWDVKNIKSAIRGLQEPNRKPNLQPFGELPEEILRRMAESDDQELLLSLLSGTKYAFLKDYFQNEEDPTGWEDLLDKNVLEQSWNEVLSEKQFAVLIPYFAAKIDAKNILLLLRGKNAEIEWNELQKKCIQGGESSSLEKKYEMATNIEELIETFRDMNCYEFLSPSLSDYKNSGELFLLEKALKEYVLKVGRDTSRLHPYGVAPIAGFLARKEVEAENVRLIVKGKDAGFSPEEINEFLIKV